MSLASVGRTDRREPARTGGVAVVLGTRPEIIKLAGIIEALGDDARLVHTGQHYDEALSGLFFDELGLEPPAHLLRVGGSRRGTQIGSGLASLDELFAAHRPDVVVVQGDTNATIAGALAANAAEIPLVHVEAGLRSHDRAMPEEHNRIVTDHLSDLCCAATTLNADNLVREGICEGVVVTGNTVVEAVERNLPAPEGRAAVLARHGLEADDYAVATIHRPENTDCPSRLGAILAALGGCGTEVIVPLHPRTRRAIERFGLEPLLDRLRVVEPVGAPEFLALARHAALLVSDSGGIQEECTVLKRPLVVVRTSTERPEALEHFARLIEPDQLAASIGELLDAGAELRDHLQTVASPYGDGTASARITSLVRRFVGARESAA